LLAIDPFVFDESFQISDSRDAVVYVLIIVRNWDMVLPTFCPLLRDGGEQIGAVATQLLVCLKFFLCSP
jgi:hypothetical protein